MASKPTNKPNWIPSDDVTKIIEPTVPKKNTGWLALEKPPFQFFNWFFNITSKWIHFHAGAVQYNIIVGGDSDERDYATMAAYIADSPAAGDRVLIKADEVLTATLVIPADIEVTMLKGNKFTLATNFSPIIQLGNNVKTKGDFRVENSDTGTIAKGFSINGDNSHHNNLIIENKNTGTLTDAFYIEAGAEGNYSQCRPINSGGGAITNDLTDNSGNDENHVTVKGDSAISHSRGAKKFDKPSIIDFTNAQHDHEDADDGGTLGHNNATDNPTIAHGATGAVVGTTNSQALSNKTLTTPIIADLTNAQHDHSSAPEGGGLGQLLATDLTLTGAAASPPDANTLVKDNIIKGWINLNGTTGADNGSFNVSGTTDNGTGDFTITWDTDFANINYAISGICRVDTDAATIVNIGTTGGLAVGAARIITQNVGDTPVDGQIITIIAIGDQS